jgi:peptidyl-prolyl cis-trans isomerase SurA
MKQYLSETGYVRNTPFPSAVQAYQQYVVHVLMEYKRQQIEHDRDYQHIAGEYRDGLLLFEISEREVWMKAAQDSTGLMSFYKKNTRSFRWERRMDATVYYCADKETAIAMQHLVNTKNTYIPVNGLSLRGTDNNIYQKVDTARQVLPKSENTIASRIKWKKGCSKILEWNGKFVFLDVHAILRPARKTFLEARGEVIAGYQQELERQWINRLMKAYPVTVDEAVWTDLKKKYAE